jgi:hypothetical protein
MGGHLRNGARAGASYVQAVFGVLGLISLVAWIVSVVTSKQHHPLTYWLVVGLALLLVASLIWGARRGSSHRDGVHIHMEGGDIIYQVTPGRVPSGAPEAPAPDAVGADDKIIGNQEGQ